MIQSRQAQARLRAPSPCFIRPLFEVKGADEARRGKHTEMQGGSLSFRKGRKQGNARANQTVHCPATACAGLGDSGLCAPPLPFGQGKGRNLVVTRFCTCLHIIHKGERNQQAQETHSGSGLLATTGIDPRNSFMSLPTSSRLPSFNTTKNQF